MLMKSLRTYLIAALCALAGLPAWADPVGLEESVAYLPGAQPDDKACAWEADLVAAAVAGSNGAIARADKPATPADTRLVLEIARLSVTRKPGKGGETLAVVRGNLVRNGKLLATRDFQNDESFKNDQPACSALKILGASLGKNVSSWVATTSLMECGEDCAGIHPEETIVIAAEILLGGPEAINDTVRDECRWPTAMVTRLVKAYGEIDDPAPRAKLEARAIDIEKYPGRRLVLRVKDIHALGGGGLTGPKWMAMAGELRDGNALVASFYSYTTSGRGLTTCRSVDSLSDSTADMIVKWLLSPSMNAQLK